MKLLYRPHRATLADAMAEIKEFSSIKEMFEYLVQDSKKAFDVSDIYISYYGYDNRIDWETYIVTVGRYGSENYMEKYHHPQAVGFFTIISMKGGVPE